MAADGADRCSWSRPKLVRLVVLGFTVDDVVASSVLRAVKTWFGELSVSPSSVFSCVVGSREWRGNSRRFNKQVVRCRGQTVCSCQAGRCTFAGGGVAVGIGYRRSQDVRLRVELRSRIIIVEVEAVHLHEAGFLWQAASRCWQDAAKFEREFQYLDFADLGSRRDLVRVLEICFITRLLLKFLVNSCEPS